MKRKSIRTTAYVLAAAITFSGFGLTAEAAGSGALFSGGVDIALANGNKLENISYNDPASPLSLSWNGLI